MDLTWLARQLEVGFQDETESEAVATMRAFLEDRAAGFAAARPDAASSNIMMLRRGLGPDESASFLRAVSAGIAEVDEAGYVTLPSVRQKTPIGRYALFSKTRSGISVNLEYIIQIGATAELVLDHGWPAAQVGFEQGEFDAVTYDPEGRIVLVMEAKARTTGPDSLDKLVRAWIQFMGHPDADLNNNAGRKWRELTRLCLGGPLTVWLVADKARWTLTARTEARRPRVSPGGAPRPSVPTAPPAATGINARAFDASLHSSSSLAGQGRCSWHGRTCQQVPVISFEDPQGRRQSGCHRAVEEFASRGELAGPVPGVAGL